jgi:glycosyltransferase involved in cell wall biosynthesis
MRIGTNLCNELVTRHEMGVIAIGMGYDGREHHWPFSITPCSHLQQVPSMVNQIRGYGAPVEAIVVALDIPLQEALIKSVKQKPDDPPYVGIFPLEAGPLCLPWAMELMKMDARLVMSRFGQEALKIAGVESEFIPIGINDPANWRPPTPEERQQIREGLGWEDDAFIILTVADNQERKNLAGAMEIFADFAVEVLDRNAMGLVTEKRDKRKTQWHLVTRVNSPVGWKLDDLAMRLGVMDKVATYNRGVPENSLWAMFAGADCFLLASKAEGLAVPVMEAMAVKLPVVATDAAAMAEHLNDKRGLLIEDEYYYTDPFGNGDRYMASIADGVDKLTLLAEFGSDGLDLDGAYEYVLDRTWEKAGNVLAQTIQKVRRSERQEATPDQTIQETVGATAPIPA